MQLLQLALTFDFNVHELLKLIDSDGKCTLKARNFKPDLSKTQTKHIHRNICFHIKLKKRDKLGIFQNALT